MKKIFSIIIPILIICILFSGCARKSSKIATSAAYDGFVATPKNSAKATTSESISIDEIQDILYDETSGNRSSGSSVDDSYENALKTNRKIIMHGDIIMQTLKFDETVENVKKYVVEIGGYTESSNIRGISIYDSKQKNRIATFTFRIPQNKYEDFFDKMKEFGTITRQSSTGEDVTTHYYDTEARLNAYKIQEERLLELLKEAKKMSDILEIEEKLTEVRYEIENLTSTLKKLDNLVDYSTITVEIHEVYEIEPLAPTPEKSFGEKIAYTFSKTMKGLVKNLEAAFLLFVSAIPYIVFIGIIALIVFVITKLRRRKK